MDNRVPPPLVGLLTAALMALLAAHAGLPCLPDVRFRPVLVGLLTVTGLAFDLAGLLAFRSRKTTVNPLHPERASALVTHGVYRFTRNPMYIGMVCLLLAWGVYLSDAAALLLGPLAYVLYLNRFQIGPEEQVLLGLFGDAYRDYMARVRRWL